MLTCDMFVQFQKEILAEMDPKGVPGSFTTDHILRFLCLVEEKPPYSVCYDADWPEKYLECWKLKKASQSRSVIDLIQQVFTKECHNLQRMVFSFRQDFNIAHFDMQRRPDGSYACPLEPDPLTIAQVEAYNEKIESGNYLLGMSRLTKTERLQRIKKHKLLKDKIEADVKLLRAALEDNLAREVIELHSHTMKTNYLKMEQVMEQENPYLMVPELDSQLQNELQNEINQNQDMRIKQKWANRKNEIVLIFLTKFAKFFENLDLNDQAN